VNSTPTTSSADDPLAGHPLPAATVVHSEPKSLRHRAMLTLGALGVVFGDIGTSPIYALRQTVEATGGNFPGSLAIMGTLSLIFWALVIVVSLKYVGLIMRADNDGEGGTLALAALAHRSPGLGRRYKAAIGTAAIIGLALSTATEC
jgi:KUP system potassium uptake protein